MEFVITINYRPSTGGMTSYSKPMMQKGDFWEYTDDSGIHGRNMNDDLYRCIRSIRKNSRYNHKIFVCIDGDMEPSKDWLKEFGDNIFIYKANNLISITPQNKVAALYKEIINYLPDDIILCHCLIADAVVTKNWDYEIEKAYRQYGDRYIYAPMFIEPRTVVGRSNLPCLTNEQLLGLISEIQKSGETTHNKIWVDWRRDICCHSLTYIPTIENVNNNRIFEKDIDNYINIANSRNIGLVVEDCGKRDMGFWAPLIGKNIYFKAAVASMPLAHGWDMHLESNLGCRKVVVTNSFVLHSHMKFELDNIEVEHV